MKIGIIVAMDKEFAQLKTLLTESQVERKNYKDFVIGKIGNNEVVMQQCGIGKVNSTIGAVEMIDNYHPDLVISSGVAGGADINLNVTEVVVATNCVYHDMPTLRMWWDENIQRTQEYYNTMLYRQGPARS